MARFSNSNVGVDHAGIGVDVISFKPGGGFQSMSGTSMACPHVCGFIAALLSGGDNKTVDVRKRLAEEFTLDIGIAGPDNSTGLVRRTLRTIFVAHRLVRSFIGFCDEAGQGRVSIVF